MALTIKGKVRCSFNKLLIDKAELLGHAVTLINVQYAVGGLTVGGRRLVILRHTQEWCWLARIITVRKIVGVITTERRFDFVEFKVSYVEFQTHHLLCSMVHVEVN